MTDIYSVTQYPYLFPAHPPVHFQACIENTISCLEKVLPCCEWMNIGWWCPRSTAWSSSHASCSHKGPSHGSNNTGWLRTEPFSSGLQPTWTLLVTPGSTYIVLYVLMGHKGSFTCHVWIVTAHITLSQLAAVPERSLFLVVWVVTWVAASLTYGATPTLSKYTDEVQVKDGAKTPWGVG